MTPQSPVEAIRHPAIAVIGCGYWGSNLLRNFSAMGVLRCLSDTNQRQAQIQAETYGVPAVSVSEILADQQVDAVAIAAPAAQHSALAETAILAGKDVFVEKPLGLRVEEGRRLCELVPSTGQLLMVGHLLQYHPAFIKLKEMVHAGEIGRLQYIYSNRLNLGKIRREEDILWSFAPHDISMILGLTGEEPERVTAIGASYLHNVIADVTTSHLVFPSGAQAHIFVSWLHPYKEQKLVVVGERGMLVFNDGEAWQSKLVLYRHTIDWQQGIPTPIKSQAEEIPLDEMEPLSLELEHFVEAVRNRTQVRTDAAEGLRVLRVLAASSTSMASGGLPVVLEADRLAGDAQLHSVSIHSSSYVDSGCEIGPDTRIWHFSHVLTGSTIGRNCNIGQNVVIGPNAIVGDNCKIQNNVSVYEGVILEDGVFCGPSCVFTNVLNPRAEVNRKDEFRTTRVGRGASLGANCTIVCGNDIGSFALIGAGAVVTESVPDHALMVGVPARRIGWVSHDGERLGDDLICPRSGRKYVEVSPNELKELP